MQETKRLGNQKWFLGMSAALAGLLSLCCLDQERLSHAAEPAETLNVICVPDEPVAHPGESITVRTWIVGSLRAVAADVKWSASPGTITGSSVATWTFPDDESGISTDTPATAKASIKHKTLGSRECQVRVYFVSPPVVMRGPNRPPLLSGRTFLVGNEKEPKGYGLYSYILFAAPPRNKIERERFLKGLESYLRVIQPIEEFQSYRKPHELNITIIPIKKRVGFDRNLADTNEARNFATELLDNYNYARAQALLADFKLDASSRGPFLVSKIGSSTDSDAVQLSQNISHVEPRLMTDWIRHVLMLATQETSWTDKTLPEFALNIHNIIAVAARNTPRVLKNLNEWIRVFKFR